MTPTPERIAEIRARATMRNLAAAWDGSYNRGDWPKKDAIDAHKDCLALLSALDAANAREPEICVNCGSTKSMAEIQATGAISCCPERKMVSAKALLERAEAREREWEAAMIEEGKRAEALLAEVLTYAARAEAAEQRVRELEAQLPPLLGVIGDQRLCVGAATKGPTP